MNDNKFQSFVDYIPTFACALIILFALIIVYQQERELSELKRVKSELEQERISLLQKCNEALMEAKHPEYFQKISE